MKHVFNRTIWLLLLALLVACAPSTPAPAPTATPDYNLSQTHTRTDLLGATISLRYPANWVEVLRDDVLLLSNDPSIALDPTLDMPSGSVAVSVSVIPSVLVGFSLSEGQDPTPYNILINYVTKFAQSDTNPIAFAQPQLLTFHGQPAASIIGSNASDETLIVTRTLAEGRGYALIITVADKGELAQWQGLVTSVVDTLSYQP